MTAARKFAAETESKIDAGTLNRDDHTMHELIRRYRDEIAVHHKGAKWTTDRCNRLLGEFPDKPLAEMQAYMFAEWRDRRLKVVQGASVRRDYTVINAMFNQAIREWNWLDQNPLQHVKRPKNNPPRTTLITDKEREMICEHVGYVPGQQCVTVRHYAAAMMEFGATTAARLGEMANLRWDDVDISKKVATLVETKNGSSRQIPLRQYAIKILKGLDKEADRPFPVQSGSLSATFRGIKHELGLSHINFHDSRATAITDLASKVDISTLAKISGHRDPRILQGYYRKSMSDIADDLD